MCHCPCTFLSLSTAFSMPASTARLSRSAQFSKILIFSSNNSFCDIYITPFCHYYRQKV
nr:MAG TPA: hypothetical protein [Caudoviricetes sp.]